MPPQERPRRGSTALWTLFVACVLAGGCQKSTELLVVITTDLVLPTEADRLQLDISRAEDGTSIFSQTYDLASPAALPASLDLHGSRSSPSLSIRAQLLRSGQVLVERRATLPFEPERALELRLALDRDCVGSTCGGDLTCAAGACVPVVTDSATLPAIDKQPLAPVDMGLPVDLAGSSGDLGVADLASTDLAVSSADLGCSAPSLLPVPTTGCTSYSFGNGVPPELVVDNALSVTMTPVCGNALEVAMPQGTNDATNEFRIRLASETLSSPRPYTVYASYDVITQGPGSWVGVEAYVGLRYVRGETQGAPGLPGNDVGFLRTNALDSAGTVMSAATATGGVGTHVMALGVPPSAYGATWPTTYTLSVDQLSAVFIPALYMTSLPTRAFYVGNVEDTNGARNDVTVRLYQLVFCDQ